MISIVCPCYNAGNQLERLVASVLCQTRTDYELIIVDGMSSDADTIAVLKRHESAERVVIVREADGGLYDAMNKGVRLAKGEWLYFIGADDQLANGNVLESINASTDADIIVGRALVNGKVRSYTLDWRIYFENTLLHQAVLYRKSVFTDFSYIPSYTVSSDYDLNFHLYRKGAQVMYTDTVICQYATCGVSSHVRWQSYKEEIAIRRKHIGCRVARELLAVYSASRYLGRKLSCKVKSYAHH